MEIRERLARRLQTLQTLIAPGTVQRGVERGSDDMLENALTRQWKTEARLIQRVLDASGDPVQILETWRERTEAFQEQHPDRAGWTDAAGNDWHVEFVLDAISNLLEHIENWQTEVEIEDEEA